MNFGEYEGSCAGCDQPLRLDDLGLCKECRQKLERDLLRKRDWDYSVSAFGASCEQREALRAQVIKKFGENLELIAASQDTDSRGKRRKRRKPNSEGGN